MESLVTTDWLEDELGTPGLALFDASWFLPDQGRDAQAEYIEAHLPGAQFLDLGAIRDTDSTLPMMRPPVEKFAVAMMRLGLGDGSRVVLYDDSPLHSAARAWWLLKSYGVERVALLDGGLAKWRAEGKPLTGETPHPRNRHFTPQPEQGLVRSLDAMRQVVAGGAAQIVDARSPTRFAGEEPEPRPGLVPGHIPGSKNLPYGQLFHPDGTWKRGDELRAAFTQAGINPDEPMVATCGSGVTAAVLAFGAHLLGRPMPVYDGSWAEWGSQSDTVKETGPA